MSEPVAQPLPDFRTLLGPSGPIAQVLGEYEHRPAQVKMAETVWAAVADRSHALIEAGTGTGKSIAYLVPILLSDRKLIISTANKALQSQLRDKDVPLVRQAFGLDFDTVLIKGRQNYLCLRKYQVELPQQRVFEQIDGGLRYNLDELDDWVRSTETGDLEELPFVLDPDMLSQVTCPADECLHRDCLYYEACFVMRIRQCAAEARVVITNHHLLISDLQLRSIGGISLPDTDLIVCDEAHQIEEVATSIFETTVTDYTVPRLLQRQLIRAHTPANRLDDLAEQNRAFFEGIRTFMQEPVVRLSGDWEEGIRLGHSVRDLAESLAELDPYGGDPDAQEENATFGLAVQAVRTAGDHIIRVSKSSSDGETVRYAEQARQRHVSIILHATPISAAKPLGEHLFGKNTVICTSATLSTGGTFELFKVRCGIQQPPLELVGEPVFDFATQALIYLPDLRTYDYQDREAYFQGVAEETCRLLDVSRGRAFCLFTSWAGMQLVADALRDRLPWPVFVQGEMSRPEMLRAFKSAPHSVLFGTKSFWEGVDVPGEALSIVIIDKLPFPSPQDPLHEARTDRIAEQGGNPFAEYTLPMMILALKQGFGRLIRTKTDRGVVAILDSRLTAKHYGSQVLRSLPPARATRDFADVYRFFAVGQFVADYALTAWVYPGEEDRIPYQWQLTRLPDGRTRNGSGMAGDPYTARWAAVLAGVKQLHDAIERGKRRASDFRLEVRLPGVQGNGRMLIHDVQGELLDQLRAFGSVQVMTLEGFSSL